MLCLRRSLQLSELEVNLPGSDVSVPSSFIIQGYTYVYDACQDISFKTRRFYSDASTAADLVGWLLGAQGLD